MDFIKHKTTISPKTMDTWSGREPETKYIYNKTDFRQKVQQNDTIFVSFAKLKEFDQEILPHINTDITLITLAFHLLYPDDDWMGPIGQPITNHPNILSWFATNIGNYTCGYFNHPKVHPFPIILKPNMGGKAEFRNPVPYYRSVFMEYYQHGHDTTIITITTQ
jgi:hypothetical protein